MIAQLFFSPSLFTFFRALEQIEEQENEAKREKNSQLVDWSVIYQLQMDF